MGASSNRLGWGRRVVDFFRLLADSMSAPMQIVASLVAIVFFVLAYHSKNTALQGAMASVSASFIFLIISTLIQNVRSHFQYSMFRSLFGKDAAHNKTFLVYPDFVLSQEAKNRLGEVNPQLIYQKGNKIFEYDYRVDASRMIADNDLQALVYVAGLFGQVIHQTPPLKVDSQMAEQCDASFISFGLSSNDCTHMYRKHAKGKALFEIVPDGNGSEFLRVDGEDFVTKRGEGYYGIIVRYHPDPEHEPDRVWMLCGGLGERGTTGAAWFLANRWRYLLRRVGDRDFVAVIEVEPNTDRLSKDKKIVTR
jgi:hypothetical protein